MKKLWVKLNGELYSRNIIIGLKYRLEQKMNFVQKPFSKIVSYLCQEQKKNFI